MSNYPSIIGYFCGFMAVFGYYRLFAHGRNWFAYHKRHEYTTKWYNRAIIELSSSIFGGWIIPDPVLIGEPVEGFLKFLNP